MVCMETFDAIRTVLAVRRLGQLAGAAGDCCGHGS
jgi:hypothetical protein